MRIRSPRLFTLVASVLLCLPLTVGVFETAQTNVSQSEKRTLASWPQLPRTARDWRALPAKVDAFLADHFGLRDAIIHLQSTIAYVWLRESNVDVLVGHNGRLFYYGDGAIAQSAGELMRPDRIQHTVDVLTDAQRLLSARGIKLVVASPPNAASVYDDDLPSWARNAGRETEPDLTLKRLKARGLTVVDLRQVLRAARGQGNLYYRSDTHWTWLGAVIGYNAIATAAGHPDWAVKPDEVLGPTLRFESGDLAHMLGVGMSWPETIRAWGFAMAPITHIGPADNELELSTGVSNGPSILIVGDSFTEGTFASLMTRHASRIGWVYDWDYNFDWSWITAFKPDEVWWLPTERLLLGEPGDWPKNMPRPRDEPDPSIAGGRPPQSGK